MINMTKNLLSGPSEELTEEWLALVKQRNEVLSDRVKRVSS